MKHSFQTNWSESKLWSKTHCREFAQLHRTSTRYFFISISISSYPLQFQGSHKGMECGRRWSWQVCFSMEQSFSYCYNKTSWTLTIALGIAHPNDISLTSKQSSQGRVCLESLTTEGPHALQQHSWVKPLEGDSVSLSSCQHQQSL